MRNFLLFLTVASSSLFAFEWDYRIKFSISEFDSLELVNDMQYLNGSAINRPSTDCTIADRRFLDFTTSLMVYTREDFLKEINGVELDTKTIEPHPSTQQLSMIPNELYLQIFSYLNPKDVSLFLKSHRDFLNLDRKGLISFYTNSLLEKHPFKDTLLEFKKNLTEKKSNDPFSLFLNFVTQVKKKHYDKYKINKLSVNDKHLIYFLSLRSHPTTLKIFDIFIRNQFVTTDPVNNFYYLLLRRSLREDYYSLSTLSHVLKDTSYKLNKNQLNDGLEVLIKKVETGHEDSLGFLRNILYERTSEIHLDVKKRMLDLFLPKNGQSFYAPSQELIYILHYPSNYFNANDPYKDDFVTKSLIHLSENFVHNNYIGYDLIETAIRQKTLVNKSVFDEILKQTLLASSQQPLSKATNLLIAILESSYLDKEQRPLIEESLRKKALLYNVYAKDYFKKILRKR